MRERLPILLLGLALLAGCTKTRESLPSPTGRSDEVSVVNDGRDGKMRGPGRLGVPPGHYPPPGACRLWFPGRPPGRQPRPTSCEQLVGRVPPGAFVLYNGKEWDSGYDWGEHERRNRGSVPALILEVLRNVRR
jgi:hypothetical protein